MWDKAPEFSVLDKSLADAGNPVGMRMRSLYFLRQLHGQDVSKQDDVVCILARVLKDPRQGSLIRHEAAYVMGQLRDERCCAALEATLRCDSDCVMVRHECAEAIGAISSQGSLSALQEVMIKNQGVPELAETCQLAINVMEWRQAGGDVENTPAACACMLNPYSSIDPAPPHPAHADKTFGEIGDILCDANAPMFERYRAMFSLRNRGGQESVLQLCRALTTDTSSALLRHEVAYVLGQMQHPASVEALAESLRRTEENMMVRHESAEALGAIEGRWSDVEKILMEFTEDKVDAVRESCLVALDAADYWGHNSSTDDEDNKQELQVDSFAAQKAGQRASVDHFNIKPTE